MDLHSPRDLVERLSRNPAVVGIVRYGSRNVDDVGEGGDFDLFVFADELPDDVESVHFYLGDLPVDLNVRRVADFEGEKPRIPFDRVVLDGDVLMDRTGQLKEVLAAASVRWGALPGLTEHDVVMNRFCQRHALDKVRGRLDEDPLYCEFLLCANVHWLVSAYFAVRRMQFPGERRAISYLAREESSIHELLRQFYASKTLPEKYAASEEMTALVLAPIGGPWRRDEVLTFGYDRGAVDVQDKGAQVVVRILGPMPS